MILHFFTNTHASAFPLQVGVSHRRGQPQGIASPVRMISFLCRRTLFVYCLISTRVLSSYCLVP
jgi:hypothetical protein